MRGSSPASKTRVLTIVAFLLAGVLGWFAGRQEQGVAADEKTQMGASKAGDRSRWSARIGRASSARLQVRQIRDAGSREQSMRSTIALASGLSVSQFGHWIDGGWFDHRAGPELTLFRKILEERWRKEDPEGFVAWCLGGTRSTAYAGPQWAAGIPRDQASAILADWALNDPERLSAYFRKYPDQNQMQQLISKLAAKDPDLAAERLLELASLGISGSPRHRIGAVVSDIAEASPEALEKIIDRLPAELRASAESYISRKRLATSFDEEIRKLWARPDGWKIFAENIYQVRGMADKLLGELPDLPDSWRSHLVERAGYSLFYDSDPEPWLTADLEGAAFTADQANKIRVGVLGTLGDKKPVLALEVLLAGGVEIDDSRRESMIGRLFGRARSDPGKIRDMLAMLESEDDRQAALNVMETREEQTRPMPKIENADDLVELMEAGELSMNDWGSMSHSLRGWSPDQLAELTNRFQGFTVEQKDGLVKVMVRSGGYLSSVAPSLNGEVLRHMIESPGSVGENEGMRRRGANRLSELVSSNAVGWVLKDPAAASAWVDSLPVGEEKTWAQKNMAANWSDYDPDAVSAWIGTLDAEARLEVREFMESPDRR